MQIWKSEEEEEEEEPRVRGIQIHLLYMKKK
jgi:hypothetical protein